MMVEIDETLNAVELENAGNTDKSIPLSNSNSLKFHGDPISFNPFWDSFASAVDDNSALSDVDKFNYLRNLFEGPAVGAIRGLPLTVENYESAKAILNKRFGQPQVIVNAHMEGVVKVSAVSADNV